MLLIIKYFWRIQLGNHWYFLSLIFWKIFPRIFTRSYIPASTIHKRILHKNDKKEYHIFILPQILRYLPSTSTTSNKKIKLLSMILYDVCMKPKYFHQRIFRFESEDSKVYISLCLSVSIDENSRSPGSNIPFVFYYIIYSDQIKYERVSKYVAA